KRTGQNNGSSFQELDLLKNEKDQLNMQLARSEQEVISLQNEKNTILALLKEENNQLRNELIEERNNHLQAQKELEKSQSYFNAQTEKIDEQKREIESVKLQMNKDFEIIANKILQEKT